MNNSNKDKFILIPIYNNNCINCKSINTYSISSLCNSIHKCNICNIFFRPQIIGYKNTLIYTLSRL